MKVMFVSMNIQLVIFDLYFIMGVRIWLLNEEDGQGYFFIFRYHKLLVFPISRLTKADIIDIPEVTRCLFSSIKAEAMFQISVQYLYNSQNFASST